ncbi:MAG: LysM peptidoglycan-binding domain-containing protein [Anaerolineae bacterium]|nr:LysM peptidoglycan-binding domain-containing protein [Anaerolineae bacterium]MDK1080857.1 LysM peptidoglycan-binding domain-containing protein [Anaerolineae bacterium]MDK1117668.1 LysM peptidoglycan-binding domain-containing protein [Anaerolineae bacterium]
MDNNRSTRSVIEQYRKRRQRTQAAIVWVGAGLFILIGVILIVIWLNGPSKPLNTLFATDTPTPSLTFTPAPTLPPSNTPTITPTQTQTPTATQSAPYLYIVQEGESLAAIVEQESLGDDGITLILLLNPFDEESGAGINPGTQIVFPGQEILLPFPGMELPTATPVPADLARGTKLTYTIQPGDTLAGIASFFNSTVEDIIEENELTDPNAIFVGQQLIIPANLITPTATFPPTSTPLTPVVETPTANSTP